MAYSGSELVGIILLQTTATTFRLSSRKKSSFQLSLCFIHSRWPEILGNKVRIIHGGLHGGCSKTFGLAWQLLWPLWMIGKLPKTYNILHNIEELRLNLPELRIKRPETGPRGLRRHEKQVYILQSLLALMHSTYHEIAKYANFFFPLKLLKLYFKKSGQVRTMFRAKGPKMQPHS